MVVLKSGRVAFDSQSNKPISDLIVVINLRFFLGNDDNMGMELTV